MPRKRTIPDDTLLDAALVIVRRSGPESLTFAALAAPTGLAPSTLVQRFGTKAALLRAALSRAWDLLDEQTAAALAAAENGRRGVIDLLVSLSGQYDGARDPDQFADQLLILREDLRDPVLRDRGASWIALLSGEIEARLAGPGVDVGGLGRLVVSQWQGALTVWSFTRDAPLPESVRRSLESVLMPPALQVTKRKRSGNAADTHPS